MLEPVPLHTYPPNEEIIRLCRELLRDAKSGRLQAFAVATAVVNIDSLNNMTTENIMKYTRGWKYALFDPEGKEKVLLDILRRVIANPGNAPAVAKKLARDWNPMILVDRHGKIHYEQTAPENK